MDGPYRGPDRRPPAPGDGFDRRALGAGAAGGAGTAALLDVATGADPHAALAAVVGAAPLVVATVLLLCAWRVGGRARPAHAAVALALAGGAGPLAAWLASSAAPGAAVPVTAVALAAGLLAAVPHARAARRGAEVDTAVRPGLAVLGGSGLVLAAAAGAASLAGTGWLAPLTPVSAVAQHPWSLLWPVALGAGGGAALGLALSRLRAALRAQRVRGLRALVGLQRSAADLEEDRVRRHDARSALAAVRAASAVLTGQQVAVAAAADQRALAAALQEELSRVERLLGGPADLLSGTGAPGVVDLREAVAPVVTAWRARGLDVTGPPPGPPVPALGSEDAVRRAVANLLDNALRHAPGAAVTLTATAPEDGGAALLVVQDDGPGVPAAARDGVFAAGTRLAPAGAPGEGLGLASARALAEADGGSLRLVASDRGARFELRLPAARNAHAHEEVTAR
ncbi:ATP-binding protein [Streptomyces sp. NP160]|uniref:sensor histidine kinase n=1 Tax=Streptomyces sp. NP160 TaxID=2586637 RepID=UPI00111A4291|nr:ATP-binding protein [Streptomyces sp. NP160]TNM64345.1 ATP-binding protein [Streptomyces sp. NP160]